MRTFFEWLFGYCPCCGRWFQYSTKRRRQSTSYEDDKSNYIICCKVVQNMEEALMHMDRYSSRHSEAIITNDYAISQEFTKRVDAAAVYVNASTRFTDGGEFGFGAEIGISTQKLHARGPMGLEQLTSWKYILRGNGQIRK